MDKDLDRLGQVSFDTGYIGNTNELFWLLTTFRLISPARNATDRMTSR